MEHSSMEFEFQRIPLSGWNRDRWSGFAANLSVVISIGKAPRLIIFSQGRFTVAIRAEVSGGFVVRAVIGIMKRLLTEVAERDDALKEIAMWIDHSWIPTRPRTMLPWRTSATRSSEIIQIRTALTVRTSPIYAESCLAISMNTPIPGRLMVCVRATHLFVDFGLLMF